MNKNYIIILILLFSMMLSSCDTAKDEYISSVDNNDYQIIYSTSESWCEPYSYYGYHITLTSDGNATIRVDFHGENGLGDIISDYYYLQCNPDDLAAFAMYAIDQKVYKMETYVDDKDVCDGSSSMLEFTFGEEEIIIAGYMREGTDEKYRLLVNEFFTFIDPIMDNLIDYDKYLSPN